MALLKSRSVGPAAASSTPELPHIITDKLYPAVAGKLLDGSTSHSGAYGTAQADGFSYYYTDIKGSKPIKDPRIGAQFGSQRHRISSIQFLEEEAAAHGSAVYSIDGREWMRAYGPTAIENNAHGVRVTIGSGTAFLGYLEIVGYFSDMTMQALAGAEAVDYKYKIDGGSLSGTLTTWTVTNNTPLGGRYVGRGSSAIIVSGQTLGIHTLTFVNDSVTDYFDIYTAELIAQDTTSTATRSQIQIPSQNVVSFGKKFTVADTPHYDPFNGFVNDTSLFSDFVDTATSLGLGTGTLWGAAWDKGSSNHIRPYNGGRVVKWVDSVGVIKTSVNMMPANAQNIGNNASNGSAGIASAEITTPSATNVYLPAFSDDVIDHSLAEVAKTFNWREFGNGAANGGPIGPTWADASMLDADDDVAYVMDDGLTSFSGESVDKHGSYEGWCLSTQGEDAYITFIGTGFSIRQMNTSTLNWVWDIYIDGVLVSDGQTFNGEGWKNLAQNLPYGTHIVWFKQFEGAGAQIGVFGEYSFHQPKMPPVPEDAVILADYMLMADTVQQATSAADYNGHISKGYLRKNLSRDFYYSADSGSSAPALSLSLSLDSGFIMQNGSGAVMSVDMPHFGTKFTVHGENANTNDSPAWGSATYGPSGAGSVVASVPLIDNTATGNAMDKFHGPTAAKELGLNELKLAVANGYGTRIVDFNTPIHTSSHYQTFETPYLYELLGGDRNMEQTNLVVTSDGKTWDEVTRDTSYIGNEMVHVDQIGTAVSSGTKVIFDDIRGRGSFATGGEGEAPVDNYYTKDFSMGWDRLICLRTGNYSITASTRARGANEGGNYVQIFVNGVVRTQGHCGTSGYSATTPKLVCDLEWGDYVQLGGSWAGVHSYSGFFIERN